jgi:hypothetical protein
VKHKTLKKEGFAKEKASEIVGATKERFGFTL